MKKRLMRLCVVFVLGVLMAAAFAQIPIKNGDNVKVLFVGNSLTGNRLGGLGGYVQALFEQNGFTNAMTGAISIAGGSTLELQWKQLNDEGQDVKQLIKNNKYDIVVLQGYDAAKGYTDADFGFGTYSSAQFIKVLRDYAALIRENGGIPVLFMRWPTAAQNKVFNLSAFKERVAQLQRNYDEAGAAINAPVVPVAQVFAALMDNPPAGQAASFLLQTTDNLHPTDAGKFASTYTFFTMLSRVNPQGMHLNYGPSVPSAAVQQAIQKAVWEVIASREDWATTTNFLTVSPTSVNFARTGGSQQIAITTDLSNLSVTKDANWLTTTLAGTKLTITAAAHEGFEPRTATVVVSAEGKSKNISVTQERNQRCAFSLSTNQITVDYGAVEQQVTVNAEGAWTPTVDVDWVTLSQSGTTLNIAIAENPACFRNATITIAGCDTGTVTIAQNFANSGSGVCDTNTSIDTGEATTIEAENFTAQNLFKVSTWAEGFSGTGYVESERGENVYLSYTISVPTAGQYTLGFHYLNADAAKARTMTLFVNDAEVEAVNFPITATVWNDLAGWKDHATTSTFRLNAGTNTIKLQLTSAKAVYLDKLLLIPAPATSQGRSMQRTPAQPWGVQLEASGREVAFTLDAVHTVTLEVYRLSGQKVATVVQGSAPAGRHAFRFSELGLQHGFYLARLQVNGQAYHQQFCVMR